MGMLSNFIAGGAAQAADLYGKQALEDMRLAAELQKAQRIGEITAAQAEAVRQQTAGRMKDYFAPVTSTVTGVPAAPGAFEYGGEDGAGGNVVATPDTTTARPATIKEAADRALATGRIDDAAPIHNMLNQEERIRQLEQAAMLRAQTGVYRSDSLVKVGAGHDEAKTDVADTLADSRRDVAKTQVQGHLDVANAKIYDKDGKLLPSASLVIADQKSYDKEMLSKNRMIEIATKEANRLQTTDLSSFGGKTKDEKAAARNSAIATQQKTINQLDADKIALQQARLAYKVKVPNATGMSTSVTPDVPMDDSGQPTGTYAPGTPTQTRLPLSSFMGR